MSSFTNSVNEFIKNAEDWLSTDDLPAVATLMHVAERIDSGEGTPALIAQFGLVYRALLKRKPAAPDEQDELDRLLGE